MNQFWKNHYCNVQRLFRKEVAASAAKRELTRHSLNWAEMHSKLGADQRPALNTLELFTWLEKKGWKPNWHMEAQDSADFTLKELQQYTKRLIENESSLGDQLANKKRELELSEKLEQDGLIALQESNEKEIEQSTEYEDDIDVALN